MRRDFVLFDFDGTVFNTLEGITKCVLFALERHGFSAEPSELRCFAGPPLAEKFTEVYGVSREEAEEMVRDFRERYKPVGIYESEPFPGIGDLLARLRAGGLTPVIATSKPRDMAEFLLRRAGLLPLFEAVEGSTPGKNDDNKRDTVLRALERGGIKKENAVLVGDTRYDVEGAHAAGIPCIGVRWGYAAPGELEAAGADAIAETMDELALLLLKEE